MSGFGRKGLGTASHAGSGLDHLRNGGAAVRTSRPLPHAAAGDELARKREAFLAAERANRSQGDAGGGLSDLAMRFAGTAPPRRSLLMAYLLWFVLGQVSAHRFYLGAYRSAMLQAGTFVFWLTVALITPKEGANVIGPFLAVVVIGWCLWILGDVFFIRRLHRRLCAAPTDASVFA